MYKFFSYVLSVAVVFLAYMVMVKPINQDFNPTFSEICAEFAVESAAHEAIIEIELQELRAENAALEAKIAVLRSGLEPL